MTTNEVEHRGIVVALESDRVVVSIVSQAACSSCTLKGSCSVGEVKEKVVELRRPSSVDIRVGQPVTVVLSGNKGLWAVALGYFFPFLVLLISLMVMQGMGFSEAVSGLAALGMLIPYYLVLYILRQRQQQRFEFQLKL